MVSRGHGPSRIFPANAFGNGYSWFYRKNLNFPRIPLLRGLRGDAAHGPYIAHIFRVRLNPVRIPTFPWMDFSFFQYLVSSSKTFLNEK